MGKAAWQGEGTESEDVWEGAASEASVFVWVCLCVGHCSAFIIFLMDIDGKGPSKLKLGN